jgi:hypothetical protein
VNEKMPAIVQRLEGLSALGKLRHAQQPRAAGAAAADKLRARG